MGISHKNAYDFVMSVDLKLETELLIAEARLLEPNWGQSESEAIQIAKRLAEILSAGMSDGDDG